MQLPRPGQVISKGFNSPRHVRCVCAFWPQDSHLLHRLQAWGETEYPRSYQRPQLPSLQVITDSSSWALAKLLAVRMYQILSSSRFSRSSMDVGHAAPINPFLTTVTSSVFGCSHVTFCGTQDWHVTQLVLLRRVLDVLLAVAFNDYWPIMTSLAALLKSFSVSPTTFVLFEPCAPVSIARQP